jgi:hypothetical protein
MMTINKNYLWLIILLSSAFIIRMIFLEAPLQSDDTTYFSMAKNYSEGLLKNAPDQTPFRSGLLIPLHGLQSLFGYNITTYYIFSISFFLFLVACIFFFCNSAGGLNFAIYAVAIASTSALILNQTSNLLPDVPNLTSVLISFIFFIYASKSKNQKSLLYILFAAIAGFYSYTVRLPNIVLLSVIPLYDLLSKRSLRNTIIYGLVFAFCLACEMGYFWWMTGDPLIRLKYVTKGVSLWTVYMPSITVSQYLLDPIIGIGHFNTGKILWTGGIAGFALAVFNKKWEIVSLFLAGTILFSVYSYSIQSVDPLVRSLPLQPRYIIGFSVVMTIGTAYLLHCIGESIIKRSNGTKYVHLILIPFVTILLFQISELPSIIRGSILLGNDSYFVADRLFRQKMSSIKKDVPIFAYPIKDFQLYPNFSKLNLLELDYMNPLRSGQMAVYSRKRFKKTLYYAEKRGDNRQIEALLPYVMHVNPEWDYLFETGDIVLVRVKKSVPVYLLKTNFAEYATYGSTWKSTISQCKINEAIDDSNIVFELPANADPFYIFTFPGSWKLPPPTKVDIFNEINNSSMINIDFTYKLKYDLQSIGLFVQQYDNATRISSERHKLNNLGGIHKFNDAIRLKPEATSFRLLLRFMNERKNTISLKTMTVTLLQ